MDRSCVAQEGKGIHARAQWCGSYLRSFHALPDSEIYTTEYILVFNIYHIFRGKALVDERKSKR